MEATVVYEDRGSFDDGTRYEMIATAVPESDQYPEAVKYRFQYMAEDGRTVLRFDNFPDPTSTSTTTTRQTACTTTSNTPTSKPTFGRSTPRWTTTVSSDLRCQRNTTTRLTIPTATRS